jgi:hypothetical protein
MWHTLEVHVSSSPSDFRHAAVVTVLHVGVVIFIIIAGLTQAKGSNFTQGGYGFVAPVPSCITPDLTAVIRGVFDGEVRHAWLHSLDASDGSHAVCWHCPSLEMELIGIPFTSQLCALRRSGRVQWRLAAVLLLRRIRCHRHHRRGGQEPWPRHPNRCVDQNPTSIWQDLMIISIATTSEEVKKSSGNIPVGARQGPTLQACPSGQQAYCRVSEVCDAREARCVASLHACTSAIAVVAHVWEELSA